MNWRRLAWIGLIVAGAAFIIELTGEPWQTALTAGAAVVISLIIFDMTKGRK